MSQYKPYLAYRDSGVEGLRKVPEHWEVKHMKFIAAVTAQIDLGEPA